MFYQQPFDTEKAKKLDEVLGYLNGFLAQTKYVAADNLTIADFTILATLTKIEAVNHDLKPFPNVVAYIAKCKKEMKNFDECCQQGSDIFGEIAKKAGF